MPKKGESYFFTIKNTFMLVIMVILILYVVSASLIMAQSVREYRVSRKIHHLNDVSDDLFTAVANLGFERGRVNVVLNDAGPIDGMEDNRAFIRERRTEGEEALDRALAHLREADQVGADPAVAAIGEIRRKVAELRDAASADLIVPLNERDSGLPDLWFAGMNSYIDRIDTLLVILSRDISDSDGMISRYSSLKHKTLELRNTAGPEISILSAVMLSGKPLKEVQAERIASLRTLTLENFKELDLLAQPLGDTEVYRAFRNLKSSYDKGYAPYRGRVLPLAMEGGPYPCSQEEFLSQGVFFLNGIAGFMDIIAGQTNEYTTGKLIKSRTGIIWHALLLAGSLSLICVIFFIVNGRIINPMAEVTETILRLGEKETDVTIPYLSVHNEVGDMARAVNVFKNTLEEVRDLRQIIPICSYCKSVRNDKGYYEEIETYFAKYTESDLTHTICPDCLKKFHPRIYEKMNKKK